MHRFTLFIASVFMVLGAAAQTTSKNVEAKISTTMGDIVVKLYDQTPRHRDNFVKLSREGFYDSLLFHRVIADFMIQTGDPSSKTAKKGDMLGEGDNGYTIAAEIRAQYRHKKGVLAAAREDNPEKASSGSHFYITAAATPHLDGLYTIFGEVVEGMSVVDKISTVATDGSDRPRKDVRIKSITIYEK